MKQFYDFAFSMGAACSCTESLRKAGLQFASFPFDWLYGADLRRRTDILCRDFEGWLRLEDLKFAHPARPGHKFDEYENVATGLVHNHDFLKDTPIAETYSAVKAKYDRRVARLFRQIGRARRVLIAFLSPPTIARASDEDLRYCRECLQRKFPATEFDLLHIVFTPGVPAEKRIDRRVDDKIRVVEYDCQAKVGSEYAYAVDVDGVAAWLREEISVRDYRTLRERMEPALRKRRERRARRFEKYGVHSQFGYVCAKLGRLFGVLHETAPVRPIERRREKKILLIRNAEIGAGLFAVFARNLAWMKWAHDHGMTPFVDYMSGDNKFKIADGVARDPWTHFFLQEPGADPLALARAGAVAETPDIGYPPGPTPSTTPGWMKEGDPQLAMWRAFAREHVRVNPEIVKRVDAFCCEHRGQKILGCLVRGTDYVKMRPKSHPVQPDPAQVACDAEELCAKCGLTHVFLATEDVRIRELFRQKFGDRLLTAQDALPHYEDGSLARSLSSGADYVEMSRQYLVSMLILARCRHLLAGCASGTIGALLFSEGFEFCRVYDLGLYD